MEFWNDTWTQHSWQILQVGLVILLAAISTRLFRWLMRRWFKRLSEKDPADVTRLNFIKNAGSAVIWIMAMTVIIYSVPSLKALAITIFAGAGIFVAILGFAAQQAFSNIISGVFIVLFKPFRVGDFISIGERFNGSVEDITLRHTVIKNFENQRIVIPNSSIGAETITNWNLSEDRTCRLIDFGISYGSNIDLAISIIQDVASKNPLSIDNRTDEEKSKGVPEVVVRVSSFGDSSVNLKAFVWTSEPKNVWPMQSAINKAVKERFDAEGVEIPFPYRTIVYKNDLQKEA